MQFQNIKLFTSLQVIELMLVVPSWDHSLHLWFFNNSCLFSILISILFINIDASLIITMRFRNACNVIVLKDNTTSSTCFSPFPKSSCIECNGISEWAAEQSQFSIAKHEFLPHYCHKKMSHCTVFFLSPMNISISPSQNMICCPETWLPSQHLGIQTALRIGDRTNKGKTLSKSNAQIKTSFPVQFLVRKSSVEIKWI